MAVVPYKIWEDMKRWKQESRPKLPVDPKVSQTVELQHNMSNVLENDQLSESEKADLYGQTLFKFQEAYKKAKQQQHQSKSNPPGMALNLKTFKDSTTRLSNERVLESVPKTMRNKAQLLMNLIDDDPSKINWDTQGRVSIEGKPIQGSNIVDLVNDVLRNRKTFEPRGWQYFTKQLADMNIPQDIVGNTKRWQWMQNQGHTRTPEHEPGHGHGPEPQSQSKSKSKSTQGTPILKRPRIPFEFNFETPDETPTISTIKKHKRSRSSQSRDATPVGSWVKW